MRRQVHSNTRVHRIGSIVLLVCCLSPHAAVAALEETAAQRVPPFPTQFVATEPLYYPDGRPGARWRLEARDVGRVLKHGAGPGQCDYLGARDVWVWESGGTYYMHYDGAGTNGWLACLATSPKLTNWTTRGAVLELGRADEDDSASASYGTTFFDGKTWHMFYMGTRHVSRAPELIPVTPYFTMKARA